MLQFFRTTPTRFPACAGILTACLLLSGCATFMDPGPQDPFRAPVAPVHLNRELMRPFAWSDEGKTAAGEPLQTASIGTDGFRTLVVGSVGGNDPVAVRLTEDLARYLHESQLIMGGVSTTVLRTLNPDGMKLGRYENAASLYLNNQFPTTRKTLSLADRRRLPREVQFVTNHIIDQRPQRILHIRTIQNSRGMLALSRGAEDSGREVARWLGFEVRRLPEDVSQGTLEFWAAQRGDCDVITVGIPESTEPQNAWTLYGDAVVSLLLDGDSESRRVAREQQQQRSADRSGAWPDATDQSAPEMFSEDIPGPRDSAAAPATSEVK